MMAVTEAKVVAEVGVGEEELVDEVSSVVMAWSATGHAARQRSSKAKNILGKGEFIWRRL